MNSITKLLRAADPSFSPPADDASILEQFSKPSAAPSATRYEHEEIVRANEYLKLIELISAERDRVRAQADDLCHYADELMAMMRTRVIDLTALMHRESAIISDVHTKLREMYTIVSDKRIPAPEEPSP